MLNLKETVPNIEKYPIMKIIGAGKSTEKYNIKDVCTENSFLVLINYIDVIDGLTDIHDTPILFFAHDYQNDIHPAKQPAAEAFFKKDNVYVFLHNRDVNPLLENEFILNSSTDTKYLNESVSHIKNLVFYEKAQLNYKYFEESNNSLIGLSSSVHSPMSFPVGNPFIKEMHLYGLDLYIYRDLSKYDSTNCTNSHAMFNGNRNLLNYIRKKRDSLKIVFKN